MMISRKMILARYVVCMGKKMDSGRILMETPEGKKQTPNTRILQELLCYFKY
jgi:hypothetical protein